MSHHRKFFRDLFTGRDGKSYDLGRVMWAQALNAFILLAAYAIYHGAAFDLIGLGTGIAAILAGGGASLGLKSGTEPPHEGDVTENK